MEACSGCRILVDTMRKAQRLEIRRAIAKPLRELRAWRVPHVRGCICAHCAAIRAIDAATKAPKRKATK